MYHSKTPLLKAWVTGVSVYALIFMIIGDLQGNRWRHLDMWFTMCAVGSLLAAAMFDAYLWWQDYQMERWIAQARNPDGQRQEVLRKAAERAAIRRKAAERATLKERRYP